ncbi:30S ribosome-binding factor RbfA [bacterium]|nr:MAG: 30S ribosome-binding factor RbfA [bacterium]
MPSVRTRRVADLLKKEVASLLQKEVKDPRVGFITITDAEVSPDLKVAKVFYTVFGDAKVREDTARGLESARPFIRREVGKVLQTKSTPELRFIYDESVERGLKLEDLIAKAAHESHGK